MTQIPTTFEYSRWRHGGWYVSNIRYASGACGCVSRNYPDGKWRIACHYSAGTFPSRDAAALAEWHLANTPAEPLATEPTEQGLQFVIPGCEKDKTRGPVQADLF